MNQDTDQHTDERIHACLERLERLTTEMSESNRRAARQNRILQRLLTTTHRSLFHEAHRRTKEIERRARFLRQWTEALGVRPKVD